MRTRRASCEHGRRTSPGKKENAPALAGAFLKLETVFCSYLDEGGAAAAGAGAAAGDEAGAAVDVVAFFFFLLFFLVVVGDGTAVGAAVDSPAAAAAGAAAGLAGAFVSSANAEPSERTATATRVERVFFILPPIPLDLWPVRG